MPALHRAAAGVAPRGLHTRIPAPSGTLRGAPARQRHPGRRRARVLCLNHRPAPASADTAPRRVSPHRLPRILTPTPRSVTSGRTHGCTAPEGTHESEVVFPAQGEATRVPVPSMHLLSAPRRLRPGLQRGLAGAGWVTEGAVAAAGAERAAARAGTPATHTPGAEAPSSRS